jgi:hypothetical protein
MTDSSIGGQNPTGFMAPLTRTQSPIQLPSYDPEDQGGNEGGNTGAGGAEGGNSGGTTQNASGGGQQPVAGATQGGGQFTYKEDRSDWVPRHRLNDNTSKYEKKIEELTNQITGIRTGVGRAFGFEKADPQAEQQEQIKTALLQVFPNLKALESMTPEKIQELMESAEGARSTTQAHWERHATSMLTTLESQVTEALGVENLTPTQQKNLRRAYREEARDCLNARNAAAQSGAAYDASNDFLARHERGDQSLLKEFAKSYLNDWFEPARRRATADVTRRQGRPVPKGERARTMIAGGPPKIDYNDPNAFKKALLAARGGGQE